MTTILFAAMLLDSLQIMHAQAGPPAYTDLEPGTSALPRQAWRPDVRSSGVPSGCSQIWRVVPGTARVVPETARVVLETARVVLETARVLSETARVLSETARVCSGDSDVKM